MVANKALEIRYRLKNDFEYYASKCLHIRSKDGEVLPLQLNAAQLYIHSLLEKQYAEKGYIAAIILKGRQQGCSTYIEGRFYWKTTHNRGKQAYILTHDKEATENLFKMAERYHENCPVFVRPSTGSNNAKELYFSKLDSGYHVGTAGNRSTGRSRTIQYFHGSEVAFWPHADEHAAGILQAIPAGMAGTEKILESTANGIGNYFHRTWQAAVNGQNEFIPIFIPWFWQDEYQWKVESDFSLTEEERVYKDLYQLTDEQVNWRRHKIAEMQGNSSLFDQEYPATAALAFQMSIENTLIKPAEVMRARKYRHPGEISGPVVIGCDPARGGDRTSFCVRKGRKVLQLDSYNNDSTMEIVHLAIKYIRQWNPRGFFIDIGGLGAGVVDRLREMGYESVVTAVNFGERASDPERYYNKRAEMWDMVREWLTDTLPVEIPDSDSLHGDLCAPKKRYHSNSRLLLESKEEIRGRGLQSPDEADALALTFALPVNDVEVYIPKVDTSWVT